MYQTNELSGKQKAAILLIALGPDISAQIFKHLREEDIEKITLPDREEWFNRLCHTEWTVDEIRQGIPLKRLEKYPRTTSMSFI